MKLYSATEATKQLKVSLRTFKTWLKKFGIQAVQIQDHGKKFYSGV